MTRSLFLLLPLLSLACGPSARVSPPSVIQSHPGRLTVLFFLTTDCPISNAYAPEIGRICAAYAGRGVEFRAVYPDPDLSAEKIEKHRAEFGIPCVAVPDPAHRLTDLAGVTVTPEVAIFIADQAGRPRLIYRGRIDDRYTDVGRSRAEPTTRDVRQMLDQALAGRPPDTLVTTRAFGCHIPS